MGYLGYQVADQDNCTYEVQAWFERQEGKPLRISGITVVSSRCDYGTDPEDFPWSCDEELFCFKDEGDKCTFSSIRESYTVWVTDLPSDCWGNTATFCEISLIEGCFELFYSDESYLECSNALEELLEGSEGVDAQDFIAWVSRAHPELVSEISETVVCNGAASQWAYTTTNRALNSIQWREVALEYLELENA